jgi:N-acetylglucosamine-6-phosphate deacetylase
VAKRGAHAPLLIRSPPKGFASFEEMYGAQNVAFKEDWLMDHDALGVRIITSAPEIVGVLDAVHELDQRGIVFSIGHRYAESSPPYGSASSLAQID